MRGTTTRSLRENEPDSSAVSGSGAASYWERVAAGQAATGPSTGPIQALAGTCAGRRRPALDIGCGEGALIAHLAELGYRAVGVDCSPPPWPPPMFGIPAPTSVFDFTPTTAAQPPHPAFAVITCVSTTGGPPTNPASLPAVTVRPPLLRAVFSGGHPPYSTLQGSPQALGLRCRRRGASHHRLVKVHVHELGPSFHCYRLRP